MEYKNVNSSAFPTFPLAELHAHLGTSINPAVYWQIAHDLGFKLPKRDFHEFINYVTISAEKPRPLNEYFEEIYHPLLDKLSSGTHAVERATYEIISGAYRANNITLLELRNNPMKHNHNAELDLDHIIMAMLRGMERALLEYANVSAGIIFCMAREFSLEQNSIILEKAIKYKRRGVVGIDVAGPITDTFRFEDYKDLFDRARSEGLRVTVHSGEVKNMNDMWEALEFAQPQRIGHGIRAVHDRKLMDELVKRDVVLEVCPLSNLATQAVENMDEMEEILRKLVENKVKFTINTDWPEVIENAHLREQFIMLKERNILSEDVLRQCNDIAFASTFVPKGGINAYL